MANIGYATLSVIPSFQGFQSKLSGGVAQPMAAAGKQSGAKFGTAAATEGSRSFRSKFGSALKGFNPLAGLAIGAGIGALFKGAIDEASALSESGNKINVVFGDAGEQINEFARGAADSIGQSELAARNAAATMGVFGKAAGLTGQELAGFSTELTTLASDLASFYDTSVDQAAQALSSGLRGEAEPLRQYGVLLDDATLKAEAMRQGLIETTKNALTPQQKILSAHAVILEQTSDAQGDFARTSDGLANSQRQLAADWSDMKAALGEELLPAAQAFVTFAKDDMLPTLSAAGGVAKDLGSAFADLPGPVKAAAGAFVALKLASAVGLTTAFSSGVRLMRGGLDDLRIRAMMAGDAFRSARSGSLELVGNSGRFVAPVGRMSASLRGLSAAAAGVGGSLRRGLGGAIGMLGGPWGAAFVGGAAVVTAFWKQQQEAKQRVEDMTATLDEQTGALTENSTEWAASALNESGALEAARRLGIDLETVTQAALGNADAMTEVRDAVREYALANGSIDSTTVAVTGGIAAVNGVVNEGTAEWQLLADATGKAADANDDAAGAIRGSADASDWAADAAKKYGGELDKTRERLQDLIDKEQERADNAVSRRRDQLGLIQALQDTRKELNEGKRTLDINTEAGQANREALYDLADQWNTSADAVKNKKGAWKDTRQQFVDIATAMGGGGESARARAEQLADALLQIPKPKVDTKQIDRAKTKIEELTALLDGLEQGRKINLGVPLAPGAMPARAGGGNVNAHQPYWVGEREAEVFVPETKGQILNQKQLAGAGAGVTINIDKVIAPTGGSLMDQLRARSGGAIGGNRWN